MYIVLFCSLFALLLTWLESSGKLKCGMKLGFYVVTFLGCIHYDYGNDYMSYYDLYKHITSFKFELHRIIEGYYFREPGWTLLCWLFKPIGGFFTMVAALNIFQNWIIYKMFKRYVNPSWYTFSMFIYLFNTAYYLMSFTMMRQMLVAIVFFGLWPMISQRKWVKSLLIIFLSSFIHSSAIILIPFSFWGYMSIKNGKLIVITYLVLLLTLWLGKDFLNQLFLLTIENNEQFSGYADTYGKDMNKGLELGLGFAINLIPLILGMNFLLKKEKKITTDKKRLVALALVSSLITPFANIIQMIARLSIYFGVYNMVSYPYIYGVVANKPLRMMLLFLAITLSSYAYIQFFHNEVWIDKFTEFHTIFSQI